MALTPHDRDLLRRCLHHEPGAWNDFVDRFLGLVYHVIHHAADLRSFPLNEHDTEDIAAAVMLQIVDDDYAVLRQFRGRSSLATYLTVIARRTCVHEMARRAAAGQVKKAPVHPLLDDVEADEPAPSKPMEALDEVAQLLKKLPEKERAVVRLYFLEGKTYEEISSQLDLPMNSIGPILTRARKKMRADVTSPSPESNPRKLRREKE